ncbi:hypothetical protein ACFLZV_03225, partial [Candidatus Margulisiibacteriota bacterium]
FSHEIGYTRESLGDMFRLYFDPEKIKVLPASTVYTNSLKKFFIYGIIRPLLLKTMKLFVRIVFSEGAENTWFEHRAIMAIAQKK